MRAGRLLCVVLCAMAVVGCGPEVAARVDGSAVTMRSLETEIRTMLANRAYVAYLERGSGASVRSAGRDLVAQVLTMRITAVVVHRDFSRRRPRVTEADRRTATDEASAATGSPTTFSAFPASYRRTLVERAAQRVALRRVLVRGVTPESYYAAHREDYIKPCVHDILVPDRPGAEAARRRIVDGESFAHVAREVSIDSGSAPDGGDLGCNGVHDLLPALNDAVLRQRVGEVGEPIRTDDGYHVLLVRSRDHAPLGRVLGEVEGAIQKLAKDRLERLVVARLRRADVDVASSIGTWNGTAVDPR